MELDDNQLEKLMQADINMRESIATLESQISEIKTKRAQVQEALNEACRTLNVTSIKTKAGTLTRKLKTRYWTSDWPEMYKFMKENDALDKRIYCINT
jgi:phage shock protein A